MACPWPRCPQRLEAGRIGVRSSKWIVPGAGTAKSTRASPSCAVREHARDRERHDRPGLADEQEPAVADRAHAVDLPAQGRQRSGARRDLSTVDEVQRAGRAHLVPRGRIPGDDLAVLDVRAEDPAGERIEVELVRAVGAGRILEQTADVDRRRETVPQSRGRDADRDQGARARQDGVLGEEVEPARHALEALEVLEAVRGAVVDELDRGGPEGLAHQTVAQRRAETELVLDVVDVSGRREHGRGLGAGSRRRRHHEIRVGHEVRQCGSRREVVARKDAARHPDDDRRGPRDEVDPVQRAARVGKNDVEFRAALDARVEAQLEEHVGRAELTGHPRDEGALERALRRHRQRIGRQDRGLRGGQGEGNEKGSEHGVGSVRAWGSPSRAERPACA